MKMSYVIIHSGKGHLEGGHSGRYPWGSGKSPHQRIKKEDENYRSDDRATSSRDLPGGSGTAHKNEYYSRAQQSGERPSASKAQEKAMIRNRRKEQFRKGAESAIDELVEEKDPKKLSKNLERDSKNLYRKVRDISKKEKTYQKKLAEREKVKAMSDDELRRSVNRMRMESEYSKLKNNLEVTRGKSWAEDVLDVAGDVSSVALTAVALIAAINKLRRPI